MIKLKSNETILKGKWLLVKNSVVADRTCERINELITTVLVHCGTDKSGWNKLYQDPDDKRYWELSYPESDLHGGGPPMLKNVMATEVKSKYHL